MKIIKKNNIYNNRFKNIRILWFFRWKWNNWFLPNMIMINQDELKSEDFAKIVCEKKRFKQNRGNFHFIFSTSDFNFSGTDNFMKKKKMMKMI